MNKQIFTQRVAPGVIYGGTWHDENRSCTSFLGWCVVCELYHENVEAKSLFCYIQWLSEVMVITYRRGQRNITRKMQITEIILIWKESQEMQLSYHNSERPPFADSLLILIIKYMNFKIAP